MRDREKLGVAQVWRFWKITKSLKHRLAARDYPPGASTVTWVLWLSGLGGCWWNNWCLVSW